MAHTETRAGTRASNRWLLRTASKEMATMSGAFAALRQSIARRRATANLTPNQLEDIGHPAANASKPTLDIKAGLITNLMSMR